MLKYIEKTYKLEVNHGYTKRKCLDINTFVFKERALFETENKYSWEKVTKYTWETFPEQIKRLASKNRVLYKSGALAYELLLIDFRGDINPVRNLRQIDCPNAKFVLTEEYHILFEGEYTLKELIDKVPAYYAIEFLKEHGVNGKTLMKEERL